MGLLAVCDHVIVVPNSEKTNIKFSFSEVKLGMIPATISPYVVRKIVLTTVVFCFAFFFFHFGVL